MNTEQHIEERTPAAPPITERERREAEAADAQGNYEAPISRLVRIADARDATAVALREARRRGAIELAAHEEELTRYDALMLDLRAQMASVTLSDFIEQHGITAEVELADENPDMADAMPGSSHFRVTLRTERGSLTVPFTMGPALTGEPDAETVLDCIASDVSLIEEHDDPVKMVIELGSTVESSEDVDRAKASYAAIQKQRAGLEHMLGTDGVQALLYEVER